MIYFDFGKTLDEAKRDARELGVDLRSMREPLERAVREVMIPSFRKNFDNEGRPGWPPAARDYGHSLLNDTGKLKSSATTIAIWDITRQDARINPGNLTSRVGFKAMHQSGAKTGKNRSFPARPFIMMQKEDEVEIENVFTDWMEERVNARWGR